MVRVSWLLRTVPGRNLVTSIGLLRVIRLNLLLRIMWKRRRLLSRNRWLVGLLWLGLGLRLSWLWWLILTARVRESRYIFGGG